MLNQSDQPTQLGHFTLLGLLISNEVNNYNRDEYDLTDHSWILLGLRPEVSVFTPQMALVVGTKLFHKILH
jgi:hypothetical protein